MDVRIGKGHGYRDETGKLCMVRCFDCGMENWAMAVSTGFCAFCGFEATQENVAIDPDRKSGAV